MKVAPSQIFSVMMTMTSSQAPRAMSPKHPNHALVAILVTSTILLQLPLFGDASTPNSNSKVKLSASMRMARQGPSAGTGASGGTATSGGTGTGPSGGGPDEYHKNFKCPPHSSDPIIAQQEKDGFQKRCDVRDAFCGGGSTDEIKDICFSNMRSCCPWPWWAWLFLTLGILLVVGAIAGVAVYFIFYRRRNQNDEEGGGRLARGGRIVRMETTTTTTRSQRVGKANDEDDLRSLRSGRSERSERSERSMRSERSERSERKTKENRGKGRDKKGGRSKNR